MLPIDKSEEFFTWFNETIGLYPLYMCPINFPIRSPFINTATKSIDFFRKIVFEKLEKIYNS